MDVPTLRRKLADALKGRRRQLRLWRTTHDVGHRIRAAILGRHARKLDELLGRAIAAQRIDWNGHEPLPLTRRKARKATRWILNEVEGLYVSSTVRFDSVTFHGPSQRRAVDFGSDDPNEGPEREAQRKLLEHFGPEFFLELFGPDNPGWVKNGQVYTADEGEFLETLHDNHTHMAA